MKVRDTPEVRQELGTEEVLPPIEVNQRNELIDGWHRWQVYMEWDDDEDLSEHTP
jgi:hypothetical protein